MSDAALLEPVEVEDGEGIDLADRPSTLLRRDADLLGATNSRCRKWLAKKIQGIVRGFEDQATRSNDIDDWWKIYNCILDEQQRYNGDAQIFVPIIRDAINARVTRFANQLVPNSGRIVDVTSSDGSIPYEIMALLNHYILESKFKTAILKPLLRNGDVEGQLNFYIGWGEVTRQIVSRETHEPRDPETGQEMPGGEEIVDITEADETFGLPVFEVLHDADVLVLPATADSVEDALAKGGSATIVRRWSKETAEALEDAGEFKLPDDLDDKHGMVTSDMAGLTDIQKSLARAIGIRAQGPHVLGFETWLMVPLAKDKGGFSEKDGTRRLCRLWWGIDREPLGLKRNPYWNDRCPLFSAPVEKLAGVFKGPSMVEPVAPIQREANDAANERADVDHYSAMPIIRRTPGEGNAPLVLNLAAIWDAPQGAVEFMAFPDLSARANARIRDATTIIFQFLGINPAMLPQQTGRPGAKRNQAEVALEQSVDLLTVAEAVEVPEQWILTPALHWMVDLDHQFRDKELTIRRFGEMGVLAQMQDVPLIENRAHYWFQWCGAQQVKMNVAMQQAGVSYLNTMRGIAPLLQQEGYQVHFGAFVEEITAKMFGPEVARRVLTDQRRNLGMDPEIENGMLGDGFTVHTHPLDNDQMHVQAHRQELMLTGDPHGTIRVHLQEHLHSMQLKAMAMMARQMGGQQPGGQPSQGGPPQLRGPQQGAMPAPPRVGRGPPGMIRPDNMPAAGALTMPRRA